MYEITAVVDPRPHADWTESMADSCVGKPVTLPGPVGRYLGRVRSARVDDQGRLAVTMEITDDSVTGTAQLEVAQNLLGRTERLLRVALIPDNKLRA